MSDLHSLRRRLGQQMRRPRPEADQSFLPPIEAPAAAQGFLPPGPEPRRRAAAPEPTPTPWGACYRAPVPADGLELGPACAARLTAAVGGGAGRLREALALPLEQVVFLDLETCGLHGAPLFLCGLARVVEGAAEVELLLARGLGEEPAVISAAAARLAEARALVTFNGQSFDVPFLLERARYFGLAVPLPELHVDLLLHARRRYGRRFGDCRLQTLERHVCGRQRSGDDIPGAAIPGLYERYCASGDENLLAPVLYHNTLDLLCLFDLLAAMAAG